MEMDLPADLKPAYQRIQKDITQFEVFKDQVDSSYRPQKTIKILVTKPQKFEWNGQDLEMGVDFFESRSGFRRAIVQSWLKDFLKPSTRQNKVMFETLTDIYSLMIWADFDIKLETNRWLDDVLTEETLCQSDWRPFERQTFCEDLHMAAQKIRGQIKSLEEVSIWSLRPLIVKDFWNTYDKLSGFDKIEFARTLSLNLLIQTDIESQIPIIADLSSLTRAYHAVSAKLFEDTPMKTRSTALDFYVVSTSDQFNIFQYNDLIDAALEFPDMNILVRNHDEFFILPHLTRVRVGYAQPESIQQAMVSCKSPILEQVLTQNVKSDRLLYVQKCDTVSPINLVDFLVYGVETYSQNTKNNFMIFHIPSIKIAKQNWKLNTKQVFDGRGPNVPANLKTQLFGWGDFKPATVYKTNAALPIVEWLRWN